MRLLKAGIIGVAALSVLVLLFSLLFPSNVRVSRAIDVFATREETAILALTAGNWQQWYLPLKQGTGDSAWTFSGNQFTRKDASIQLLPETDTSVLIKTTTAREFLESHLVIIGDGSNGHCTVQWYADIPVKWYPWEKFGSIFFDKIIGPGMEASLQELKRKVEE